MGRKNFMKNKINSLESKMRKIIDEFKKFIMRGNVIDMAVGVIVGSAFTAIVNGMSNFILKPIINWILTLILGKDSLSEVYTFLVKEFKTVESTNDLGETIMETVIDLENSIFIDWGSFINAVINFFIIAIVLFTIVKLINAFRDGRKELNEKVAKKTLDRHERKELRENGVNIRDKAAVKAYFDEKQRLADEAAAAKAAADAEAARLEREANPTTEDLLKLILAELKKD